MRRYQDRRASFRGLPRRRHPPLGEVHIFDPDISKILYSIRRSMT